MGQKEIVNRIHQFKESFSLYEGLGKVKKDKLKQNAQDENFACEFDQASQKKLECRSHSMLQGKVVLWMQLQKSINKWTF